MLLQRCFSITKSISRRKSTIYALSSGHGKCGVAVIRVSGAATQTALKCLTGLSALPHPRTALLRSIKHPITKETLDKGLVLWFPGPASFTGEDSCEFHVHGGIAVVNSILDALSSVPDLQLAQPGEFTRRAFFSGKLDLTEVEGLADLLQAETEFQRKQAFLQTQGALSKLYNKWRSVLLRSLAHIEAHIDFEETETIDEDILEDVSQQVRILIQDIERHLSDGRKGELLRSGVRAAILGEPNVGKSSLLNLLCRRPAAIVTPIEGTTRDILEVTLNIIGYPLILADTAGLRSATSDVIEKEGISRALSACRDSELIILVADCEKVAKWLICYPEKTIKDYICKYIEKLGLNNLICDTTTRCFSKPCIVVLNKTDLIHDQFSMNTEEAVFMSCETNEGTENLLQNISSHLKALCGEPNAEHPSMNQLRHRQSVTKCLDNLNLYLQHSKTDTVMMAEYLRKSLKHLGYLVGATTSEELLDVIFKHFCIGK